jgi:zinc/manganese transport system permease protein
MPSIEMIEIVGPALAAGLMIALTHAMLGIEVLKRGIIFIDLAVAQIAGLGLVAANAYLNEPAGWIAQIAALASALLAGVFFHWIEHKMPAQQEALIGCSFVLAASLALMLLADHPHGGEEIQHLLSGQILYVTWSDVLIHLPVYATLIILWFCIPRVRKGLWFYLLFATAITSSVQLVGVYVVFASLILPALAAAGAKRMHLAAWLCGTASVSSGIIISSLIDMPAGPLIVVSYCAISIAVQIISRNRQVLKD